MYESETITETPLKDQVFAILHCEEDDLSVLQKEALDEKLEEHSQPDFSETAWKVPYNIAFVIGNMGLVDKP